MNGFRRGLLVSAISSVVMVMGVVVVPPAAQAGDLPYTIRYTVNANATIVTIGNNVLTCPPSAKCDSARAGAVYNDNDFAMTNLDADSDPSTFNSSMSRLNLPDGANVLFAGLYWGARGMTGNWKQMSFKLPGDTSYQTIVGSDEANANFTHGVAYQRFADVTDLVKQVGSGDYWGANVVASTGSDMYAGWSMIVAYTAPDLPMRNITIFDGWCFIDSSHPQTITVSGFQTPLRGPVNAELNMVVYEGDLAAADETVTLNGSKIGSALSPSNNLFDSSMDMNGVSYPDRIPADKNMLGFDIKNITIPNVLGNNAKSATFKMSTGGDVYYPGMIAFAIDLYAPKFTPSTKTAEPQGGYDPPQPGDILLYTVTYVNVGEDASGQTVSEDPLPVGTEYVPGSLRMTSAGGRTAGPLSDAPGDDLGEFTGTSILVRLGDGANASQGGMIDIGESAGYSFMVKLTDEAVAAGSVTNIAHVHFVSDLSQLTSTYDIPPVTTMIAQPGDLSITKQIDPRLVVKGAGETVTSTLTITNNGPGQAIGVVVTDPIIDGLTGVAVDLSQAEGTTCTQPDATNSWTLTCALPDMDDQDQAVITLTGTIPASVPDDQLTMNNVATVSSSISFDPDQTNNVSSDTIDLDRVADLRITKTPAAPVVAPGGRVTYDLTVTNPGPSNASDLVITDSPGDDGLLSLVSVDPGNDQISCQIEDGQAICTLASLLAGATARVSVVGKVAHSAPVGSPFTNTATVESATTDLDDDTNTAVSLGTVGPPQSDLRVVKSVVTDPVVAGSPVTYRVVVTNYGPSDAEAVVVTDQLPAAIIPRSAVAGQGGCTISQNLVTCQVGTVPAGSDPGVAGGSVTVTIMGIMDPSAADGVANSASASSQSGDPDPGSSTGTTTTHVTTSADVSVILKGSTMNLPNQGDKVTYDVVVHNQGPSVARQVSIQELLPDGLVVDGANPPELPAGVTCSSASGSWTCQIGDVVPDGDVVIHLNAVATRTATSPLTATATVDTSTDPILDDLTKRTATWTLSQDPQADLSITLNAVGPFTAGGGGTYQIVVSNTGSPNSSVPTITNRLPDGVSLVPPGPGSQTTPGCVAVGQVVTCTKPESLPADQTWPVTLTVAVSPDLADGTVLTDTATVQGTSQDPTSSNNTATVSVPVGWTYDLQLSKTVDPTGQTHGTLPVIDAGADVGYTLTVVNSGPSVSVAAVVTDTLPPGFSLESADSAACSVVSAGNPATGRAEVVACQVGSLAVGATWSAHLVVSTVGADLRQTNCPTTGCAFDPRQIVNTATVVANGSGDPNPSNDTATAAAWLDSAAELQVTLVPRNPTPPAGSDLPYDLTVLNHGPSIAENPVVDVSFPPGFVIQSWDIPGADCSASHSGDPAVYALHCQAQPGANGPVLLPGQQLTGTIITRTPDDPDDRTYTATATADSNTPQDGDYNTTSTGVTVHPVSDVTVSTELVDDKLVAGEPANYRVTAHNDGPSTAKGTVVSYTVPDGMDFISARGPDGTVCANPVIENGQKVVRCQVGDLPNGADVPIDLVLKPKPEVSGVRMCNTAKVESSSADPDGSQTQVCQTVTDPTAPDVKVVINADQDKVTPGQESSFTAVVRNTGNGGAHDVTAVFDLPDGLTDVTGVLVSSSDGTVRDASCVIVGRQLVCTVGDLGPDEEVTYKITGTANGDPGSQQTLTVANLPSDGASVEIGGAPDVRVSREVSGNPEVVHAGDEVTYTLTFTNVGTADGDVYYIEDVTGLLDDADITSIVTDPGLTVVRDPVTGRLMITGKITPGQSLKLTYTAIVKPDGQRGDSKLFTVAYPGDTPDANRPTRDAPQCSTQEQLCSTITVQDAPTARVVTGGQVVGSGPGGSTAGGSGSVGGRVGVMPTARRIRTSKPSGTVPNG